MPLPRTKTRPAVPWCSPAITGRRQGVVVVHPGEALLLHLHRLYPKQDIGGEDGPVLGLFHLEIVVNRLPFIGKVLFPEGKSAPAAQQGAEHKENPAARQVLQQVLALKK